MKTRHLILALSLCTGLVACAAPQDEYYTQKHYTNPSYTLINTEGTVEIRRYNSLLSAEVTENGDRQTAMRNGHIKLNAYFQGNNSTGEVIAMTKPIVQYPIFKNVQGVTDIQTVRNNKWIVRFYLPVEYTRASAPMPTNSEVRLSDINSMSVAALSFSGPWTDDNLQQNEMILKSYVVNNNLRALDVPAFAFYDAPQIPPVNRHNEVILRLAE